MCATFNGINPAFATGLPVSVGVPLAPALPSGTFPEFALSGGAIVSQFLSPADAILRQTRLLAEDIPPEMAGRNSFAAGQSLTTSNAADAALVPGVRKYLAMADDGTVVVGAKPAGLSEDFKTEIELIVLLANDQLQEEMYSYNLPNQHRFDQLVLAEAKKLNAGIQELQDALAFWDERARTDGYESFETYLMLNFGYSSAMLLPRNMRKHYVEGFDQFESGAVRANKETYIQQRSAELWAQLAAEGCPKSVILTRACSVAEAEFYHPEWKGIIDWAKVSDRMISLKSDDAAVFSELNRKASVDVFASELDIGPGMPSEMVLTRLGDFLKGYRAAERVVDSISFGNRHCVYSAQRVVHLLRAKGFEANLVQGKVPCIDIPRFAEIISSISKKLHVDMDVVLDVLQRFASSGDRRYTAEKLHHVCEVTSDMAMAIYREFRALDEADVRLFRQSDYVTHVVASVKINGVDYCVDTDYHQFGRDELIVLPRTEMILAGFVEDFVSLDMHFPSYIMDHSLNVQQQVVREYMKVLGYVKDLTDPLTGNPVAPEQITRQYVDALIERIEVRREEMFADIVHRYRSGMDRKELLAYMEATHWPEIERIGVAFEKIANAFGRRVSDGRNAFHIGAALMHRIVGMGDDHQSISTLLIIGEPLDDLFSEGLVFRSSISAVIGRAVIMSAHIAQRRRIKVSSNAQIHVFGVHVDFDLKRFERVAEELIKNGAKYSAATVTADWNEEDQELVVISDGTGMEAGFDPFAPGKRGASTQDIDGTGYGLFNARADAESMGAELTFTSVPGKTVFRLKFRKTAAIQPSSFITVPLDVGDGKPPVEIRVAIPNNDIEMYPIVNSVADFSQVHEENVKVVAQDAELKLAELSALLKQALLDYQRAVGVPICHDTIFLLRQFRDDGAKDVFYKAIELKGKTYHTEAGNLTFTGEVLIGSKNAVFRAELVKDGVAVPVAVKVATRHFPKAAENYNSNETAVTRDFSEKDIGVIKFYGEITVPFEAVVTNWADGVVIFNITEIHPAYKRTVSRIIAREIAKATKAGYVINKDAQFIVGMDVNGKVHVAWIDKEKITRPGSAEPSHEVWKRNYMQALSELLIYPKPFDVPEDPEEALKLKDEI